MCTLDGDYCDFWRETRRTARKEHRCACCGSPIQQGQKYVVVSSAFDGSASSEKSCLPCRRAVDKFAAEPKHMRWMPSGFREVLEECIDWDAESAKKWRPMLRAIRARAARNEVAP